MKRFVPEGVQVGSPVRVHHRDPRRKPTAGIIIAVNADPGWAPHEVVILLFPVPGGIVGEQANGTQITLPGRPESGDIITWFHVR